MDAPESGIAQAAEVVFGEEPDGGAQAQSGAAAQGAQGNSSWACLASGFRPVVFCISLMLSGR